MGRVLLNRGAGAGCGTPSTLGKLSRAWWWGELRHLAETEDGTEAPVGVREKLAPVVTRPRPEDGIQPSTQLVPAGAVDGGHGDVDAVEVDPDGSEELALELRLDRTDRDVLPVAGLVHVVERGAGIDVVRASFVAPHTHESAPMEDRHEQRRPVDHGGIDDLATA